MTYPNDERWMVPVRSGRLRKFVRGGGLVATEGLHAQSVRLAALTPPALLCCLRRSVAKYFGMETVWFEEPWGLHAAWHYHKNWTLM